MTRIKTPTPIVCWAEDLKMEGIRMIVGDRRKNLLHAMVLGGVLACTSGFAAFADETGEGEYMNSCASCHGVDGKGSGPVSSVLSVIAPPLTGLSAANDGEFPMLQAIQIIDGRTGVRGHGTDAGMPVWGAVYKSPLVGEIGAAGTEIAVRGRILSLALYLESIQE